MDEIVFDEMGAFEFLKIPKKKHPVKTIQRMARLGIIRGKFLGHQAGWRFHRKALEDALLLGGSK